MNQTLTSKFYLDVIRTPIILTHIPNPKFTNLKRQKKTRKTHWRYIPKSGQPTYSCQKCYYPGYLYLIMNFDGSITARVTHHSNQTFDNKRKTCTVKL
jgi:hypothetical protein